MSDDKKEEAVRDTQPDRVTESARGSDSRAPHPDVPPEAEIEPGDEDGLPDRPTQHRVPS